MEEYEPGAHGVGADIDVFGQKEPAGHGRNVGEIPLPRPGQ